MKTTLTLLTALLLAPLAAHAAEPVQRPPNIVFMLADDLGGGDLRCDGIPYSRTPNIDSLAKDGTRFTRYYATGATCCPTRTTLPGCVVGVTVTGVAAGQPGLMVTVSSDAAGHGSRSRRRTNSDCAMGQSVRIGNAPWNCESPAPRSIISTLFGVFASQDPTPHDGSGPRGQ
jgi:hypothetical protein